MSIFSLEQIYYQTGDPFKEQLTKIIESTYAFINTNKVKSNADIINNTTYPKEIIKLIKDRFNLTMVFDDKLANMTPAAIIPFSSDYLLSAKGINNFSQDFISELFGSTSIFSRLKSIEKDREAIYKRINNRKGFVDFKNARVGGYLADVKHFLIINFISLKNDGITPVELAGIITHEIGHVFDGLSSHYKMHTNNSAIMDTLNQLNGNKIEKAVYTFKRHFDAGDLEEAKLDKSSSVTDFYGPLAKQYIRTLGSQIHNAKYDETNYEAMADSFAVRMGFGLELTTGLDKIHTKYGMSINNSKKYYYIIFIIDALVAGLLLMSGPFGYFLLCMTILFITGSSLSDMTYDLPYDRFNRIRNGIISNLKDRTLPKEYVEDLLNQLSYVDLVLERGKSVKNLKTLTRRISDLVVYSSREATIYIEMQQTIENSLNNNLFQKSAQLRVF